MNGLETTIFLIIKSYRIHGIRVRVRVLARDFHRTWVAAQRSRIPKIGKYTQTCLLLGLRRVVVSEVMSTITIS